MKQLVIVIVALVVIGAVAFGVRTYGARDETEPVSTRDAPSLVGGSDERQPDTIDPGVRPAAGTYSYRGSGSERITALGGSTHVFPDTIAAVVKLDPDQGCRWAFNLVYIKQHIEHRDACSTDTAVRDLGFERRIEFFNQTDTKTYTCDDDARRLVNGARPGATTSWICRQGDQSTSKFTATFVGPETIAVGGAPTHVAFIRVISKQSGATRGGEVQHLWLLPSGLPAKFDGRLTVTTASVFGDTEFREQYAYVLASLAPVASDAG
ncbi:MAG: hypothetical protein JWN41_736 [Thermoleophilia bacterium]|nr:hypothetical protein [Thermoleophilia bacterium]